MRNNDIFFTSLLTIDSIQVSDAGVYHCNAGIDSNVTTNNISVCVTGIMYQTKSLIFISISKQLMTHYHQ